MFLKKLAAQVGKDTIVPTSRFSTGITLPRLSLMRSSKAKGDISHALPSFIRHTAAFPDITARFPGTRFDDAKARTA